MDNQEKWVQRHEVASLLGVSYQTIWKMANKGMIRVKPHGIRHCLYSLEDALKLQERNQSNGRPGSHERIHQGDE